VKKLKSFFLSFDITNLFIRKKENGLFAFYPWTFPGEAVLLNKKVYLTFFCILYTLLIVAFLTPFAVIILVKASLINDTLADTLVYGWAIVIPLFYIMGSCILYKTYLPYKEPLEKENKNIRLFVCLAIIPHFIFFLFVLSSEGDSGPIPILFIFLYLVLMSFLAWKIKMTRGYVFTNLGIKCNE
jgi:hypothetical protein